MRLCYLTTLGLALVIGLMPSLTQAVNYTACPAGQVWDASLGCLLRSSLSRQPYEAQQLPASLALLGHLLFSLIIIVALFTLIKAYYTRVISGGNDELRGKAKWLFYTSGCALAFVLVMLPASQLILKLFQQSLSWTSPDSTIFQVVTK